MRKSSNVGRYPKPVPSCLNVMLLFDDYVAVCACVCVCVCVTQCKDIEVQKDMQEANGEEIELTDEADNSSTVQIIGFTILKAKDACLAFQFIVF